MYAEVAWILVSSGTQVQPQIIHDPDYLPDYLSISYDYDNIEDIIVTFWWKKQQIWCICLCLWKININILAQNTTAYIDE